MYVYLVRYSCCLHVVRLIGTGLMYADVYACTGPVHCNLACGVNGAKRCHAKPLVVLSPVDPTLLQRNHSGNAIHRATTYKHRAFVLLSFWSPTRATARISCNLMVDAAAVGACHKGRRIDRLQSVASCKPARATGFSS